MSSVSIDRWYPYKNLVALYSLNNPNESKVHMLKSRAILDRRDRNDFNNNTPWTTLRRWWSVPQCELRLTDRAVLQNPRRKIWIFSLLPKDRNRIRIAIGQKVKMRMCARVRDFCVVCLLAAKVPRKLNARLMWFSVLKSLSLLRNHQTSS